MLSRRKVLLSGVGAAFHAALPFKATGAEKSPSPRKFQVWGYYPVWMKNTWQRLNLSLWDRLVLFEFPVSPNGSIGASLKSLDDWSRLANSLHTSGVKFDLALTILDQDKFVELFSQPAARQQLLKQIERAAKLKGVTGIHLDFEIFDPVPQVAIDGYRDLLQRLHVSLQTSAKQHPILSVFFPIGEGNMFDAASLSYVDYVVIQGYDAHWSGSQIAGPVSPLKGDHPYSWKKTLTRVLDLGVARSKILFSVPYFGYEWPVESPQPGAATTGRGATTTYAPVNASLLPQIRISVANRIKGLPVYRDHPSGSPYYIYQNDKGNWMQGWFEDEISLAEKFDFVIRENLCGIAVFPIGYDGGQFDKLIATKFGTRTQP